ATLTATATGNQLAIVSGDGSVWTKSFVDANVPAAFIGVLNSTPRLSAPTAGDTWNVTLHGPAGATQSFGVPVAVGDAQSAIAAAFVSLINSGGPAALTALAEGDQLAIVSRDGSQWAASFAITPAPDALPAATVANTLGAATVTFSGALHSRDIWL